MYLEAFSIHHVPLHPLQCHKMHPLKTLTKYKGPYLGEFLKPLLQEKMNVHWTFQTINYSPQP